MDLQLGRRHRQPFAVGRLISIQLCSDLVPAIGDIPGVASLGIRDLGVNLAIGLAVPEPDHIIGFTKHIVFGHTLIASDGDALQSVGGHRLVDIAGGIDLSHKDTVAVGVEAAVALHYFIIAVCQIRRIRYHAMNQFHNRLRLAKGDKHCCNAQAIIKHTQTNFHTQLICPGISGFLVQLTQFHHSDSICAEIQAIQVCLEGFQNRIHQIRHLVQHLGVLIHISDSRFAALDLLLQFSTFRGVRFLFQFLGHPFIIIFQPHFVVFKLILRFVDAFLYFFSVIDRFSELFIEVVYLIREGVILLVSCSGLLVGMGLGHVALKNGILVNAVRNMLFMGRRTGYSSGDLIRGVRAPLILAGRRRIDHGSVAGLILGIISGLFKNIAAGGFPVCDLIAAVTGIDQPAHRDLLVTVNNRYGLKEFSACEKPVLAQLNFSEDILHGLVDLIHHTPKFIAGILVFLYSFLQFFWDRYVRFILQIRNRQLGQRSVRKHCTACDQIIRILIQLIPILCIKQPLCIIGIAYAHIDGHSIDVIGLAADEALLSRIIVALQDIRRAIGEGKLQLHIGQPGHIRAVEPGDKGECCAVLNSIGHQDGDRILEVKYRRRLGVAIEVHAHRADTDGFRRILVHQQLRSTADDGASGELHMHCDVVFGEASRFHEFKGQLPVAALAGTGLSDQDVIIIDQDPGISCGSAADGHRGIKCLFGHIKGQLIDLRCDGTHRLADGLTIAGKLQPRSGFCGTLADGTDAEAHNGSRVLHWDHQVVVFAGIADLGTAADGQSSGIVFQLLRQFKDPPDLRHTGCVLLQECCAGAQGEELTGTQDRFAGAECGGPGVGVIETGFVKERHGVRGDLHNTAAGYLHSLKDEIRSLGKSCQRQTVECIGIREEAAVTDQNDVVHAVRQRPGIDLAPDLLRSRHPDLTAHPVIYHDPDCRILCFGNGNADAAIFGQLQGQVVSEFCLRDDRLRNRCKAAAETGDCDLHLVAQRHAIGQDQCAALDHEHGDFPAGGHVANLKAQIVQHEELLRISFTTFKHGLDGYPDAIDLLHVHGAEICGAAGDLKGLIPIAAGIYADPCIRLGDPGSESALFIGHEPGLAVVLAVDMLLQDKGGAGNGDITRADQTAHIHHRDRLQLNGQRMTFAPDGMAGHLGIEILLS